MDKIYVVIGFCGSDSDATEWRVRAFSSLEEAESLKSKLVELVLKLSRKTYGQRRSKELLSLDPNFHDDWYGTRYGVEEVPFEEYVPK